MINTVKEINDLIGFAIQYNISDIHIESIADGLRVRLRKDGLLKNYKNYTLDDRSQFLSRLKIMAKLDTNCRLPQDGRFSFQNADVRVSTMPTYWSEKIVLRLLTIQPQLLDINLLGLPEPIKVPLLKQLAGHYGMVLLTGPTGCGKTTTLYSILKIFDCEKENIITLEDPIEYQLNKINQVQINERSGLSFAGVLRAVLRQDPDIIFVGEIRDSETAAIALRAALTGHLVLATLHTRQASEALIRLQDLGVPEYLIKAGLNCVLAQRLYRKYCPKCRGQGCASCGDGFSGRSGIFEYFEPKVNKLISFAETKNEILQKNLTSAQELEYF